MTYVFVVCIYIGQSLRVVIIGYSVLVFSGLFLHDSFFFAFRDALWLLQWILGGRRKAAWKFFGSPLFQPLDDILHPLPVVFKADFSISVIERADFSHDPLQIHLLLACLPDVHWGGGTNISSGGRVQFWKNTSLIVFEAHMWVAKKKSKYLGRYMWLWPQSHIPT